MTQALIPVGARPDFRIYTAAAELVTPEAPLDDPASRIVRMVGSSTEKDVQKNRMAPTAIADMTHESLDGMTIFLNHSYNLPYDMFGKLTSAPQAFSQDGFLDVKLSVETEVDNPPAFDTLKQIRKKAKHGCSIGCMVLEWDFAGESDDPFNDPIIIKHVLPVEWSVVGIPANRRSWVENAISGIFTRSFNEGDMDTAYKLAPSMRSLYSHNYERLLCSLSPDTAEYRRFQRVTPRPTPDYSITWEPPRKTFVMASSVTGERFAEGRENILKLAAEVERLRDIELRERARKVLPLETVILDGTPTGDGDAAKKAQEARSHTYGIGIKDGGNVTKPGQWSSVPDSEWGDPVNYRYPMPDKNHADNAASRWGDASNRSQYNSHEQSIIGGRIKRRQAELGGGDTEEKAMNPVSTETQPDLSLLGGPDEVGGEVQSPPKKKIPVPHVDNDDALPEAGGADDYNERDLGAEGIPTPKHPVNDANGNTGRANNANIDESDQSRVNDEGGEVPTPDPGHEMLVRAVAEFLHAASTSSISPDAGRLVRAMTDALTLAASPAMPPEHDAHVQAAHDHANAILGGKGCANMAQKATKPAADHQIHAQGIHDHMAQMAKGKHCVAQPTSSDAPAQGQGGTSAPQATQTARQQKAAQVEDSTPPFTALSAEMLSVQNQLAEARSAAAQLQEQILTLQGRGLGRPTLFTGRQMSIPLSHVGDEETQVQSPEELKKLTTLKIRASDGTRCRHWPAGVGAMQRPELTTRQMSLMSTSEENAYYEGRDALVPILSDTD